jgi:uncharacterized surface protein with fasciclin (FAS1) repeats
LPSTYDTLLALVGPDCANLVDALPGNTVFGPRDEAFAAFFAETGLDATTLCGPELETLTNILTYHVVPGTILAENVLALPNVETSITTLEGSDVVVNKDALTVNGVSIVEADVVVEPFVLHGIDEVLILAPTPSSSEMSQPTPAPTSAPSVESIGMWLGLVYVQFVLLKSLTILFFTSPSIRITTLL